MREDSESNNSGLGEGSETDGDLDLSHSDDEEIEINGRSASEDVIHLRSFHIEYHFFFYISFFS